MPITAPACRGPDVSDSVQATFPALLQRSIRLISCAAKTVRAGLSLLNLIVIAVIGQHGPANSAESSQLSPSAQLRPWAGAAGPGFTLDDVGGRQEALEDFRGRIVLLHFFATWCAPCVEEFTSLQKLTDAVRGLPITVVAIDVAEVDVRVRNFVAKLGVRFPVLLDRDRAVTKAWNVISLPTTIILDSTLAPRFIVEDAIDWTRADIRASIDSLYQPIKKSERIKPAFAAGSLHINRTPRITGGGLRWIAATF